MDYERAVKVWAASKLDCLPADIKSVAIESDSGWDGTDVTAGDPAECKVVAKMEDGRRMTIVNLMADSAGLMYDTRTWPLADLLNEILSASA